MIRPPFRLYAQLSFWMVLLSVVTLIIFIIGMVLFYVDLQQQWFAGLPESERNALIMLIEKKEISQEALVTLVNTFSLSWSDGYANSEIWAVVKFSGLAIICAMILGVFFSKHLTRPIEAVTDAARAVADGEFTTNVSRRLGHSYETRELLDSFNSMTKALVRAERESLEVSASIAHELRTPLTILRGRLQGLEDGAFDLSPKLVGSMISQVDTLSHIVSDLEVITRLSSGQLEVQAIPMSLEIEVQKVIDLLSPQLTDQGFEIELSLSPAKPVADPERVRQALTALIHNVQFHAMSGKYLRIDCGTDDDGAYIRVADRGPGVALGNEERVFERWWREDTARKRTADGRGSGLGLSVVHAIAQAHGGDVRHEKPASGTGAAFKIVFPLGQ